MEALNEYFKLQEEIYNYFGYEGSWRVIPLNDSTKYLWYLSEGTSSVYFAESLEAWDKEIFYQDELYYTHYDGPRVLETEHYTMVVVDTRTDGNKFLRIFDNEKRLSEWPDGR